MSDRRFKQIDVFTRIPFLGTPVAVVLDADGLRGAQMQRIAAFAVKTGWIGQVGTRYPARQGMQLDRDGRIALRVADAGEAIWLGGDAVTRVDGTSRASGAVSAGARGVSRPGVCSPPSPR